MSILRDIFRRKLRSLLTVLGVAVGVFAVVTLGATAERMNVQFEAIEENGQYGISVVDEQAGAVYGSNVDGNRPLSTERLAEIEDVPGVAQAVPVMTMLMDETSEVYWTPPMIMANAWSPNADPPRMIAGRLFSEDERGVTVIGQDLATKQDVTVGDTIELRDVEFEVVGVMERCFILIYDQGALIPVADAQKLYVASLPEAFQTGVDPSTVVSSITVIAEEGVDEDELAARIGNEIDGVLATGPTETMEALAQVSALFNVLVGSLGGIALLVGGLSVVNTMLIAVSERVPEVGTKRALGASAWRVARDVLAESATISLFGGVLGLAAGVLATSVMNAAFTAETGMGLFLMTGRLAGGGLLFAVLVGTTAGLYPAWCATRLDPVQALAHH